MVTLKFRNAMLSALILGAGYFTFGYANAAGNEAVGAALKQLMTSGSSATGSIRADAQFDQLKAFYKTRSFKPVWSRDKGPKGKARALVAELSTSTVHGLSPKFYRIEKINKLMQSKKPSDLAQLDMMLSGALTDFGYDLVNGRLSGTDGGDWNHVEPIGIDPAALVSGAADGGNLRTYVSTIVKPDYRYIRLITKIAEFKRIAQAKYWPKTKFGNKTIAQGKSDKRIGPLRTILSLTGDLPAAEIAGGNRLDKKLSAALKRFQSRYGLAMSGSVDAQTLKILAEPLGNKISKMQINLERRRWENRATTKRALYLNLADGAVKFSLSGKTKAVLGVSNVDALTKTPAQYGKVISVQYGGQSKKVSFAFQPQRGKSGNLNIELSVPAIDAVLGFSAIANEADAAKLKKMSAGEKLTLAQPLPMFVTYITAWANRDGSINFRHDLTGRDVNLKARLELQ